NTTFWICYQSRKIFIKKSNGFSYNNERYTKDKIELFCFSPRNNEKTNPPLHQTNKNIFEGESHTDNSNQRIQNNNDSKLPLNVSNSMSTNKKRSMKLLDLLKRTIIHKNNDTTSETNS